MDTYEIKTSGGRVTKRTGYLSQIIESQKGRKTGVAIYCGGLLICQVVGGEVVFAL